MEQKGLEMFGVEIEKKEVEDKVKFKDKFKDLDGHFKLNGVVVSWTFDNKSSMSIPHIEFNGKPNKLTETGYRSWFIEGWENYTSVKDMIKDFLKATIKGEFKLDFDNVSLEINDKYFYDLRNWKKKSVEEFVGLILDEKISSNSGNQDYRIKISGLSKEDIIPLVKANMKWGVEEMAKNWNNDLTGWYLDTYGEEHFKEYWEFYNECMTWLVENKHYVSKGKSYEECLKKAKSEQLEKVEEIIKKQSEELKKNLEKKYGFEVKIIVERSVKK